MERSVSFVLLALLALSILVNVGVVGWFWLWYRAARVGDHRQKFERLFLEKFGHVRALRGWCVIFFSRGGVELRRYRDLVRVAPRAPADETPLPPSSAPSSTPAGDGPGVDLPVVSSAADDDATPIDLPGVGKEKAPRRCPLCWEPAPGPACDVCGMVQEGGAS